METTLTTDDGVALRVREWPRADAVGTVVIVHGLGEHVGRHAHVAAQLNAWGWRVVGHDQRGHGASGGARGRLAAPDDLLRDLARVVDFARAGAPRRLVLLGHSLGGLVAARFVAGGIGGGRNLGIDNDDDRNGSSSNSNGSSSGASGSSTTSSRSSTSEADWWRAVDGLVLSSPALDAGMGRFQKVLLAVLERIAPNLAVGNGLRPEWLSRDAAVVAAYRADPRVHDRIAARLARFLVDAGTVVAARAPRWNVRTLLLYAGSDRCVVPAGSATFARVAPAGVVSAHALGQLFHEIFNEPEQAQVFALLQAWLPGVLNSKASSQEAAR